MTIYEISKLANVSPASVSRVLNNKPGVRPEVRKKIEEIIKLHDFQPNLLARELIQKKTNIIGIVIPGVYEYFARRIQAISKVCKENGYSMMLTPNSGLPEDVESDIDNFKLLYEKQVDGIIYFAHNVTNRHCEILKKITKKLPVVMLDQQIEELDIPCIVYDNYNGARKVMKHLLEMGHRKIAFIGGPTYDCTATERLAAYLDVLKESDIEINQDYIKTGIFTFGSGYSGLSELINSSVELPTAVFAVNDNTAIGVMRAISENGLKVPDDISVAGFDNTRVASYLTTPLTTVNQNQYEMGIQATELLLGIIKDKKVKIKKIILDQDLIVRNSTRQI